MINKIIYGVATVIIIYLGYQIYLLQGQRMSVSKDYEEIKDEYSLFSKENEKLDSEIEYLSDPYNLEKELRSRFNYRLPNEKLIIVVPDKEDESATSTDE